MAFKFPWTNLHELNLDWILEVVESAKEVIEDGAENIATALANAAEALTNSETAITIAEQAVAGDIPDGSITTAKLASGAVTESRLDDEAVTTSKIADLAVTNGKIYPGSVSLVKLATDVTDVLDGFEDDISDLNDALHYNIRTGGNIVCFGDSWTYGTGATSASRTTNRFTAIVASKLEMTEYNYASGGERFIGGGIEDEIEDATSDMSSDEIADTRIVLIVGGLNDYRHLIGTNSASDFADAVISCAEAAHTAFPNALIVLGIGNTSLSYFPKEARNWYTYAIRECDAELSFPHMCIKNLYNVISGQSALYATISSATFHPNDDGHAIFGGYIADAIMGGGQNVKYYVQDLTLVSGYTFDETPILLRDNDEYIIPPCAFDEFPSTISSNTKFASIPTECGPSRNMYGVFYYQNAIAGACAITAGGNIYVNPTSSHSSGGFTSQLRWLFGKESNNDE